MSFALVLVTRPSSKDRLWSFSTIYRFVRNFLMLRVKVSHCTQTAILQFVDLPALPLRNTLLPEFGIFIFVSFSAKLRLGSV